MILVLSRTGQVELRGVLSQLRLEVNLGSSNQPSAVPFRSRPPLQPHLSHIPVPYKSYGSRHPPSHPPNTVYDPYLHAPLYDLAYHIHLPPKSLYWSLLVSQDRQGLTFLVKCLAPPLKILHAAYMGILILSMVFHLLFLTYRGLQIGYVRVIWALRVIRGLVRSKKESDPYILRERRMREVMVVMMIRMRVMMLEMKSSPCLWHLWHQLVIRRSSSSRERERVDRQLYIGDENLGHTSRVDAKELAECWSLLQAWIYLYFSIFAPLVRLGTEACMRYIQQFPMLGYKNENKLLDIHLRLDMKTDKVRWILYRTQEIRACWVSMWHGFIAYFDCVEPYIPDQVLRHHGPVFRPFHRVPAWMITWVGTSPAVTRGYRILGIFPVAFTYR
ncbi:hypothetical protein M9H77_16591 [Catharanthus roseus]|uniref:Uncharacterized protein n=1 Tax=Catharanthus roseus TaxID=4058 RepID=A0ACC0B278_CATRO|nr:hypothetical protein M9H77_16591 [Catharanthus roseus]